jgi:imidazolonepropionase-like amidohydrolase
MKSNYLALIFSIVISVGALQSQANEMATESLVIRNVTLVNADATLSKQPLNVLIAQGRILSIGTRAFNADRVIDGSGQYLTPGLIDSHVHLTGVAGVPDELDKMAFHQQAVAQIPKSYLYAGFTTLLDLASSKALIDSWNSHPLAPRAHFCTAAPIPNGYPMALIPEDIQQKMNTARYFLHDRHSHQPSEFTNPQAHTPAHLVKAMKKEGALCAKVFYEKGFGAQKNLPVPSEAIVRELVAEAHKQRLPVFLHGNSQESYEFALATGVDMVVHGLWHAPPTTTSVELAKIAQRLIKAKIAVQPTVQVIYGEQELFNPTFFQQSSIHHYMPAELINWYQTAAGQWMKDKIGKQFGTDTRLSNAQKYQQVKAVYLPLIARVQQVSKPLNKNSLLVFGSDTPSGPFYTQFPGLNGRLEMDRWLAMGIPLSDLFKALTIDNATRLGLEKEIGSVAKHKRADLLLLRKNPLADITAYDAINWVILNGKPIARESLSAKR